jgi:CheY-like chemotaxis protein
VARILIVEDNGGVERVLARWCRLIGHETTLASASDSWQDTPPDLVLLDLYLGEERGWDVLDRIRAVAPGVPVVVVSGADGREVAEAAAARGAVWCPKPFTRQQLRKAIEAALAD